MLNGRKYVPEVSSDVRFTPVAVVAVVDVVAFPDKAPEKVVVVKVAVDGLYVNGVVVLSM